MRPITTIAATAAAVATLSLTGCSGTSGATSPSATTAAGSSTSAAAASASATSAASSAASGEQATAAIVASTEAFIATLSDSEKSSALFQFSDSGQRQKWSNLPASLYERSGVKWGDLNSTAQAAWLKVMQATLSDEGYQRVRGSWLADDQLQGGDYGSGNYYIAIIGTPSATDAWQWQWGGHHITVNATIKGDDISLTPSFIGVQPATYSADGSQTRPLGDIEDAAFALLGSLDDSQKSTAIIGDTLIDLVLGPGQDGRTIQNEGLPGSKMTDAQKSALLGLIGKYGNLANSEDGADRMETLTADVDSTYFAWSGPTTQGQGIYFRVTGPHVAIEYSGQQMGGNPSDHVHGIYRDPTNDYGAAIGAGL